MIGGICLVQKGRPWTCKETFANRSMDFPTGPRIISASSAYSEADVGDSSMKTFAMCSSHLDKKNPKAMDPDGENG